jgi:hypothetical protein
MWELFNPGRGENEFNDALCFVHIMLPEFILSKLEKNKFRPSIEFGKTVVYHRNKERSKIRKNRAVKED